VAQVNFAKTGKHGSAKAAVVGLDVVTKRKYSWVGPSDAILRTFDLQRLEFTVLDVSPAKDGEGDAEVDYLDEAMCPQRMVVPAPMAAGIAKLLADDKSVTLKVLRVPCANRGDGRHADEPHLIQSPESFAPTTD
jgi:hypothetical protein